MIISSQMVEAFKRASHDINPLHTDEAYARKTPFGKPVAYGVLGVLTALGLWANNHPFKIKSIKAAFKKPLFVGVDYEIHWEVKHDRHIITVGRANLVYTSIQLEVDALLPESHDFPSGMTYTFVPEPASELMEMTRLKGIFPNSQLAALLWASYHIGMVDPGKSALFSEFEFHFESSADLHGLIMEVEATRFDERFNRVSHEGKGTGIASFHLAAFKRPEPVGLDWELIRELAANAGDWKGKRVLVTGALRGFGASLAGVVGMAGAQVGLNYRGGIETALAFSEMLHKAGIQSELHQADLTQEPALRRIANDIASQGKLDLLVVNATPPIRGAQFQEQSSAESLEFIQQSLSMTLNSLHAFLPVMAEQGCVVLISTTYLDEPQGGFSHYLAAKAAQEKLLDAISVETKGLSLVSARLPRMHTDQTNLPFDMTPPLKSEKIAQLMLQKLTAVRNQAGYHLLRIDPSEHGKS